MGNVVHPERCLTGRGTGASHDVARDAARLEATELMGWRVLCAVLPWGAVVLVAVALVRTAVDPTWWDPFPVVPITASAVLTALFTYANHRVNVLERRVAGRPGGGVEDA